MSGMISSMRSFGHDASVVKQKVRPGTAKRMLRFALPYSSLLALFLFVVIVDAVVGVVNPLILRDIINNGILKANAALVIRMAILAGVLGIFDAGLGVVQAFLSSTIGARIVLSLRTKLFAHIQQMPIAFFMRAQTGALVSRLNTDVSGAQTAFTDILSNVVGNLITVTLILTVMFVLSWQITLAALILLPLYILPARFWGRKLQAIARESFGLIAEMNSLMVERFNVAGAQLAKLFGRNEDETRAFEAKAVRVSDIGVRQAIYGRLFFTALMSMATFATALAYGWGGVLAVHHKLDVGTVVAFVSYLVRLYGPLTGLSNIQVSLMTALVSFERVFEVLDLPPMIREKPNAIVIPDGPARVSFDRISFRYPTASEVSLASLESIAIPDKTPEKIVLHDISFVAEPGQLVALVGPSGAGKTTITQLVSRLYDVQSGSVAINGVDVRDAKIESLRQRIGTVTQDAHLFHDTIRANLLYARPAATEAELTEALRAAQILPLIESLPKGLETLVGERGYRFSGGEKQRLAIARLLLKAPDIVILDEATAHLDSESEAAIQRAFEIALRGRTSIVIAHRLSTILKADQILVVQDGRIVERGTHPELIDQLGLYADLHRRQFAHVE
ncbi:MAG TPA: ABC transporter ATP-binding protein [Candidatus Acidoferrales bacterium]|nr:ABC transporter ATP-binding protein [Candidatus Acidoferrales bacterium]